MRFSSHQIICCNKSRNNSLARLDLNGAPRGRPRRLLQRVGFREPEHAQAPVKMKGALLVPVSLIAAIRLRREDIRPSTKVRSVIFGAVTLARAVLTEIERESRLCHGIPVAKK